MTKYFSFQYSVTYCSQALRSLAHTARETVHLFTRETPDFITPANSPDLNPVDYQIWYKLQERVYRSQIRDVDQLKSRLIEEWEHFHQVVIDEAVRQRRPRLGACVRLRAHGATVDILNTDFRCAEDSCHSHGRTLDSQSRLRL